MLIFNADKNKKIQMAIESSGIDNDKLRFTFIIDTGKVQYGFPCMFNEGRVEVDIPPLDDVIKDLKTGTYNARLDVTGDDKYYLNPFNESVEIKLTPTIKTTTIGEGVTDEIKIAISNFIEVDDKTKIIEDKDDETDKKTRLDAFFDK